MTFYIVTWILAGIIGLSLPVAITWLEDGAIDITVEGLGLSFLGICLGYITLLLMVVFAIGHVFEKHGSIILYSARKKDE